MRVRSVDIRNFGPYRGSYSFSLSCEDEKQSPSLILFTGKNGAGKSTLFQAISLCIYGPFFRGIKMKEADYQDFIKQRISGGNSADTSSIELEIAYAERGIDYRLRISRAWTQRDGGVIEDLRASILQGGEPEKELTYPQEFLLNFVPAGLAQLIFFDGERIDRLSGARGPQKIFRDGFETLVGIDVVNQLDSDLPRYMYWLNKKEIQADFSVFEKLENEINELTERSEWIHERLAEIDGLLIDIQASITEQELRLSRQGSEYAEQRNELHRQERHLLVEKETLERAILELFSNALPFVFAPSLKKKTVEVLKREADIISSNAVVRKMKDGKKELASSMASDGVFDSLDLSSSQKERIAEDILDAISSRLENSHNIPLRHKLSSFETDRVVRLLTHDAPTALQEFRDYVSEYGQVEASLEQVRDDLSRMPTDESLKPLVSDLRDSIRDLEKIEREKNELQDELDSLIVDIEQLRNRQNKAMKETEAAEKHKRKLALVDRLRGVVKEFKRELHSFYAEELTAEFKQIYNNMRPRNKRLRAVEIGRDALDVSIQHSDGRTTGSSVLSSGEQQIYIYALLGAISKISKRSLPVFIDTPFSRLDEEHRASVISKFIPLAGPQIVMFATETEVTEEVGKKIRPIISQEYHLQFDGAERRTIATTRRTCG